MRMFRSESHSCASADRARKSAASEAGRLEGSEKERMDANFWTTLGDIDYGILAGSRIGKHQ